MEEKRGELEQRKKEERVNLPELMTLSDEIDQLFLSHCNALPAGSPRCCLEAPDDLNTFSTYYQTVSEANRGGIERREMKRRGGGGTYK